MDGVVSTLFHIGLLLLRLLFGGRRGGLLGQQFGLSLRVLVFDDEAGPEEVLQLAQLRLKICTSARIVIRN
jgi:hypothetical protein